MSTNNAIPAVPKAPSRRDRFLLAATSVMFAAWLGWLGYLAFTTTRPIVLARPQFLAAQLDVIARIEDKDGRPGADVFVEEVAWARDAGQRPPEKLTVTVPNLADVKAQDGWTGPGLYILPLVKNGSGYSLAPFGASPGFSSATAAPRIYPVTPQTRAQLREIRDGR